MNKLLDESPCCVVTKNERLIAYAELAEDCFWGIFVIL
jgi:hypothetical protein